MENRTPKNRYNRGAAPDPGKSAGKLDALKLLESAMDKRAGDIAQTATDMFRFMSMAEPVSVYVETFGTEHQDTEFISQYVRENYDLTPRGIIETLGLLDVDYNKVSAYGHFGKSGLPWEK